MRKKRKEKKGINRTEKSRRKERGRRRWIKNWRKNEKEEGQYTHVKIKTQKGRKEEKTAHPIVRITNKAFILKELLQIEKILKDNSWLCSEARRRQQNQGQRKNRRNLKTGNSIRFYPHMYPPFCLEWQVQPSLSLPLTSLAQNLELCLKKSNFKRALPSWARKFHLKFPAFFTIFSLSLGRHSSWAITFIPSQSLHPSPLERAFQAKFSFRSSTHWGAIPLVLIGHFQPTGNGRRKGEGGRVLGLLRTSPWEVKDSCVGWIIERV